MFGPTFVFAVAAAPTSARLVARRFMQVTLDAFIDFGETL